MNKSETENAYTDLCSKYEISIDQEMLRRIRATTPDEVARQILSVSTKSSLAADIAESKGEDDE